MEDSNMKAAGQVTKAEPLSTNPDARANRQLAAVLT